MIPADHRKPYFLHNTTAGGFAVTVRTAAGAGVTVGASPDDTAVVYCDGTDVVAISVGGEPIDVARADRRLRPVPGALRGRRHERRLDVQLHVVDGSDPGRFGGQTIRSSQDRFITSPTFPLTASVSVGFAFKAAGYPGGSEEICRLMSASGDQVIVGVNSSRQLIACRGSISTVLGTSTETLSTGIWHYLEVEAAIDDASGLVTVWLDGVQVIDLSGVDTKQQTEAGVDRIRFQLNGLNQFTTPTIDAVYVTNGGTRLGESRVAVLYPSADTADADWTPSTGVDHYATVDETTVNGDTDYVASGTVGDLDLYEIGDLGVTPDSIQAVQVTMCARKDDAATRKVRCRVRSGAATANGAPHALTASYVYYRDIFETDPNTAAAWTAGGVNALQIGPEVVT